MTITIIGVIFLLVELIILFAKREYLIYLIIFFVPFSATSAINVGQKNEGSSIQLYMFLSLAWIFFFFINCINKLSKNKKFTISRLGGALLLFALIAFLSLLMPLYINGREVANTMGALGAYDPILFSGRNLTQFLYLFHGVILATTLEQSLSKDKLLKAIQVYSLSLMFIMAWGGLELFCFYSGIEYPSFMFNNSVSKDAAGFNQVLLTEGESIKRVASVTLEPSILVQVLLIAVPIYIYSCIYKQYIFRKNIDLFILVCLLLFIPLTTSSTGFLALFFMGLIFLTQNISTRRSQLLIGVFGFAFIAIIVYFLSSSFLFDLFIRQKSESYSALERLSSIVDGWDLFLKYPVLGVGWGVVGSHDLIIKIAANCGLIGLVAFVFFIVQLIRKLNQLANTTGDIVLTKSIVLSVSVLLFCNLISGFSFYLGHAWLIFGIAMAYVRINTKTSPVL